MPATDRRRPLLLLGAAMAALYVALVLIDESLKDTGGPSILDFEFVRTTGRAAEIMAEWGARGRHLAHWSLWLDFAFMASYGAFFTLATLSTRDFARRRGMGSLAAAGRFAPFCAAGAALFDAAENISLLLVLGGRGGSVAPALATACASVKFVLITLAIAYVLWGLVARLLSGSD